MSKKYLFLSFLIALSFSCSEQKPDSFEEEFSNEWELVILDSIQVDYLADVRDGIFNNGIGLIKDIGSTTLIKFDSIGKILTKKQYPKEGPGIVLWLETLVEHKGEFFGTTSFNNIYHFDDDLNLKESLEMPFLGEARGGAYNRRNVAVWNGKLLLWYPGRNGISPILTIFTETTHCGAI